MTADTFADLVQAKRVGTGRWKACCPAHADRLPSLSIREGSDGRILLRCFAGCELDSILVALKLAKRDLFAGPVPSPQRQAAMQEAGEAQRIASAERQARLKAFDFERGLDAVVSLLGAKLAAAPESDKLAGLFHSACDRLHEAQMESDKHYLLRRKSA
jgi:hypothetical protein